MTTFRVALLAAGLLVVGGGLSGQDKKEAGKPAAESREPAAKMKGMLPPGWAKIGLTDDQKQRVYGIDAKYDAEIDELKAKIEELKKKKFKEQLGVLTAEQKKTLEDNAKKKASGG